jgi:hypothetical protein
MSAADQTGGRITEALMTQASLKTPIEYIIVAVPFHADAATHDELARKVNEKLNAGYDLLGTPLLSEEMMYQPMTKSLQPVSPSPIP